MLGEITRWVSMKIFDPRDVISENSFLAEICQTPTQLLTWFIHDQFYAEWS